MSCAPKLLRSIARWLARGRASATMTRITWAWVLAFAACAGLAGRAPMQALQSAEAGTLLTTVCGANGPRIIDGQDQGDRTGGHDGVCWCSTHFAALPPQAPPAAFVRPWMSTAPECVGVEADTPVVACKPASTGPPHHLA